MRNSKVGVIGLQVNDRARTMIMEGISIEDRPQAVGYFILDTLRSLYQSGVDPKEPITLKLGYADPRELDSNRDKIPLFIAPKGVEDLGHLYKLIVAVSRGRRSEAD